MRRELRGKDAAGPDVWRLPADWVEVFSPVLFEPWSAQAREEALERRRAQGKKDPTVLDDLPVFASARGGRKPQQRYAVIAAAGVLPTATGRTTRLRLLRAFPDRGKAAYGLVLQELGYVPDIVVSDGAPGIKGAFTALVAADPSVNCLQVLSSFHIRRMLWRQMAKLTTAKPTFALGDLADQLDRFQLLASPAAWDAWWDTLRRRTVAQRVPKKAWPAKWERDYKPVIDEQLRALRPCPWVPASTGAIEGLLTEYAQPMLARRPQGFGNLERTNRLLDLAVLRANGQMSAAAVADRLRTDAPQHGGYASPVRRILDPGAYRSLLDKDLMGDLTLGTGD